eukprot:3772277-Amphidinium_carterae.1
MRQVPESKTFAQVWGKGDSHCTLWLCQCRFVWELCHRIYCWPNTKFAESICEIGQEVAMQCESNVRNWCYSPELTTLDPLAVHHAEFIRAWAEVLKWELMDVEILNCALAGAAKRLLTKSNPWGSTNGPCAAFILTAVRLGWQIFSASHWRDHLGRDLKPEIHSPSYLARLAAEHAQLWALQGQQVRRGEPQGQIWWQPIHDALRTVASDPLAKACLLNVVAGGSWTQQRMVRHGLSEDERCQLCLSQSGDEVHRTLACPCLQPCRVQLLPLRTREWIEKEGFGILGPGLVNGRVLPPSPSRAPTARNGACFHPRDALARRAGWSIVSIEGDTAQAVYGCLPACEGWQSAPASEEYAVKMLAKYAAGEIVVHTDCKAVVMTGSKGPTAEVYRGVRGHYWRTFWTHFRPEQVRFVK